MARFSERALQDRRRADALTWEDIEQLWAQVQTRTATEWQAGRAFEYLVVRAFALSGLRVEYAYDVPLEGRPFEQIDGMVYLGDVPFLIECKDRQGVDIEAIAKLRNQLQRRPPSTMGCLFVSGGFSRSALLLSNLAAPHRITLWSNPDISEGIENRNFAGLLRRKSHELCMFGLTDRAFLVRGKEVHDSR
ncbi:MAG TPA: restriction endonuclease [Longimicrobium sp.]|nr:restriction endonuclease [Longimicrobium sp.]